MTAILIEMEILLRAIEWEAEGYCLYNNLACKFTDSIQQGFFHELAHEEEKHRQWLEDRLKEECREKKISFDNVLNTKLKDSALKPLARTPFQNDNQLNHFPEPLTFPISFEYAIGHEHKTIEIYEGLFEMTSAASTSSLIKKLIEQEKGHIEFLLAEKARLALV